MFTKQNKSLQTSYVYKTKQNRKFTNTLCLQNKMFTEKVCLQIQNKTKVYKYVIFTKQNKVYGQVMFTKQDKTHVYKTKVYKHVMFTKQKVSDKLYLQQKKVYKHVIFIKKNVSHIDIGQRMTTSKNMRVIYVQRWKLGLRERAENEPITIKCADN